MDGWRYMDGWMDGWSKDRLDSFFLVMFNSTSFCSEYFNFILFCRLSPDSLRIYKAFFVWLTIHHISLGEFFSDVSSLALCTYRWGPYLSVTAFVPLWLGIMLQEFVLLNTLEINQNIVVVPTFCLESIHKLACSLRYLKWVPSPQTRTDNSPELAPHSESEHPMTFRDGCPFRSPLAPLISVAARCVPCKAWMQRLGLKGDQPWGTMEQKCVRKVYFQGSEIFSFFHMR